MTIATGERLLAEDMLNLAFFPQGMILMYDGTGWTDNVTLKGWYRCSKNSDGADKIVNGYTVPDLQDKFIMGHSGGGRAGGNNSLELSTANLPAHGHSLSNMSLGTLTIGNAGSHTHALSGSTAEGGSHTHGFKDGSAASNGGHTHTISEGTAAPTSNGALTSGDDYTDMQWRTQTTSSAGAHTHAVTGTIENGGVHSHTLSGSATDNGSHTHTITGGAISGTVSSSGSGTAFDNRPSYYTLIYIVKVTAAGG